MMLYMVYKTIILGNDKYIWKCITNFVANIRHCNQVKLYGFQVLLTCMNGIMIC